MSRVKQLLGTGCPKCKTLFTNSEEAVKILGIEEKVEKVADIMALGVMMTPALVIDGLVKSSGKVLSSDEIGLLLKGNIL